MDNRALVILFFPLFYLMRVSLVILFFPLFYLMRVSRLLVVFSTLMAVSGSYVFGSAIGFSSPAQTGIMDDLGLSLAQALCKLRDL
ncbi:uncharacterized protein LOC141697834 isoform X2 [Apium graveolens]|uniref:uncharacterized protein LOC141697834 isoform X2 n=1 Tax=Apium graveolens TaxID=4045 RepID=UPI003D7BDC67